MNDLLQRGARLILTLEMPLLTLITFAFWYPSPIRDRWLWLLWLLIPIYVARLVVHRRLWTWTPLTYWLLSYILLIIANIELGLILAADGSADIPLTRGWIMLGRPLLGFAIFNACVEHARTRRSTNGLAARSIWLAMALGALALGATQWPAKSDQFDPITNALPVVSNFPGTEGGFNPNEVAGALAWMLPLAAGLALYRWREKLPGRDSTLMACALLGAALFFGQSRAAILGVLAAFVVLCFLLLNTRRLRYLALAGVGVLAALQILAVGNAFAPQAEGGIAGNVSEQADLSISPRLRIWESALAMIRDYPLTGVGISFYRYDPIRSMYPVEGVDRNVLVHTHNELLQVGTDLGVPGLIVYVGIHAVAIFMIYRLWKMGKRDENYALAIAAACGILAHTIFGLYDAIPLADRFSFLFWWTFGLLGAAYAALTAATQETNPNPVDKIDGA